MSCCWWCRKPTHRETGQPNTLGPWTRPSRRQALGDLSLPSAQLQVFLSLDQTSSACLLFSSQGCSREQSANGSCACLELTAASGSRQSFPSGARLAPPRDTSPGGGPGGSGQMCPKGRHLPRLGEVREGSCSP